MKKKALSLLMSAVLAICGTFISCGGEDAFADDGDVYDFYAQYIRTNGGEEGDELPSVYVISSREQLIAYYEEKKGHYDLASREAKHGNTIGFLDACQKYDEEYFLEKVLVLVVLRENSGSISHTVTGIGPSLIDGEERFAIDIKRKIPEAATADMAEWHIIIEPEVGLQEFIHGGAEVRLTVGDKSYELVAEREDVSESAEQ